MFHSPKTNPKPGSQKVTTRSTGATKKTMFTMEPQESSFHAASVEIQTGASEQEAELDSAIMLDARINKAMNTSFQRYRNDTYKEMQEQLNFAVGAFEDRQSCAERKVEHQMAELQQQMQRQTEMMTSLMENLNRNIQRNVEATNNETLPQIRRPRTQPEQAHYQSPPSLKQPMFHGDFDENPCVFLEELNDFVLRYDDQTKVIIAKSSITGNAKAWIQANGNKINNYDRFAELFRNRYWSTDIQRTILSKLKWGKCLKGSLQDYFERLLAKVRFVDDAPTNIEFVQQIAEHFDVTSFAGRAMMELYLSPNTNENTIIDRAPQQ
ncbi:unnamed protein product [Diamesa hyperborea]